MILFDSTPARAGEESPSARNVRVLLEQVAAGLVRPDRVAPNAGLALLPYGNRDPLPYALGQPPATCLCHGGALPGEPWVTYAQFTIEGIVVPCPSCLLGWGWLAPDSARREYFLDARRGCSRHCPPSHIARAYHVRVLGRRPPAMRRWGWRKRDAYANALAVFDNLPYGPMVDWYAAGLLYDAADHVGELCAAGYLVEARLLSRAITTGKRMGLTPARARSIVEAGLAAGWNRRWGLYP